MKVAVAMAGVVMVLLCGMAGTAGAEVERWAVIRDQSSIVLSVRALGASHTGRFASWTSSDIRFDPAAPESAQATIDVRAGSLAMRQRALTERAVGPSFLDAEHYPSIRFRLRAVDTQARPDRLMAHADVTLKGRTRTVAFPIDIQRSGAVDRMTGGFVLDRVAFGVGGEGGLDGLIGRDVRVEVALTLRRTTS